MATKTLRGKRCGSTPAIWPSAGFIGSAYIAITDRIAGHRIIARENTLLMTPQNHRYPKGGYCGLGSFSRKYGYLAVRYVSWVLYDSMSFQRRSLNHVETIRTPLRSKLARYQHDVPGSRFR